MPSFCQVQLRSTETARGFAQSAALAFLLTAAACQDATRTVAPSAAALGPGADRASAANTPGVFVLRGTVVTPTGVLANGYVGVMNGRIVSVSDKQPDLPNALAVNVDGIIVPGFVDVHNHLPWNVLPRWRPPRLYQDRYQWRVDPDFLRRVQIPFDNLIGDENSPDSRVCDMNAYSEMRALVGGVTSIMATQAILLPR